MNDFADGNVTVLKLGLLGAIKANREKHEREYTEALGGYADKVRSMFQRGASSTASASKIQELAAEVRALVVPASHLSDYDCVIRMLEMAVPEQVTISQGQFQNYVLDEWIWTKAFKNVSSSYSSGR